MTPTCKACGCELAAPEKHLEVLRKKADDAFALTWTDEKGRRAVVLRALQAIVDEAQLQARHRICDEQCAESLLERHHDEERPGMDGREIRALMNQTQAAQARLDPRRAQTRRIR